MAEYTIAIQNRIAMAEPGILLICNNPSDTIRFEFDEEWSGYDVKTARFSWEGKYIDVPFSGDVVQVPEILRTNYVYIGVFADSITSAPAKVNCRYSIKCHGGTPAAPTQDVYQKIINLINHSITSAYINADGHLILMLTDENEIDCGYVNGAEGVGIESIMQTGIGIDSGAPNIWEVTLTDGRKESFTVYNGKEGESGTSIYITEISETPDEIALVLTDANGSKTLTIPKGKDGRNYVASTIHKKEREVYCYPADDMELHVISHISPAYEVGSKNLLPASFWDTIWNGVIYAGNGIGGLAITGTASSAGSTYAFVDNANPMHLKEDVYTFSVGVVLPDGVSVYCEAYEDAANWVGYSPEHSFTLSGDDAYTFKASAEHEYIVGIKVNAGCAVKLTIYPQLEIGEYATAYEAYSDSAGNAQATRSINLSIANDVETLQYSVEFERDVYNGAYDWNSGKLIDYDTGAEYTYKPSEIKALSGLNVISADTGIVEVEGYTSDDHSAKMQEYNHIPRLHLYGDTAAMTKDNAVMLRFKYFGADNYINDSFDAGLRENGKRRGGWVKVKWQGSSSIAFPKKNYTFTFYWDESGESKRSIPFRPNWGAQSKYCAKANFIDPTHCRNVVTAKLWGECVRSRNKASESYIRMNALPNAGAVDGYPMLVFINDKYQGIFTMNIPKADWMFGMKDGEGTNTVLCAEDYSNSAQFFGPPAINDTDWTYEVEPADKSGVLESFSAIYNALAMPETSEAEKVAKKTALEACVDIYSVIDYDIFINRLGLSDNNGKNQLMATYDGVKWIMSAYDLDTAFGNHWSGAKYQPFGAENDYYTGLTWAVRTLYADEHAARKAELEGGCLNGFNILNKLMNFAIDVPQEAFRAEAELWPDMCGANANAMQQIFMFTATMG